MASSPEPKGFLKSLQKGQRYIKSWPIQEKGLTSVFPEHRIMRAVSFGIRAMPPIAVFTLVWQMVMFGSLGPALTTALFACSLPLQGLWWLGRRSDTPLPASLVQWYNSICQRLNDSGHSVTPFEGTLTYQQLAELLQQAFKQIDKAFLDEL